jgi:hypothetical protein
MKAILLKIILSGISVLAIILMVSYILLPKQPKSWSKIKLGMSALDVYSLEPEFNRQGWKAIKGFDIMTVRSGDNYWQYLLYYNDNDKVEWTKKRLYHGTLDMCIIDNNTR